MIKDIGINLKPIFSNIRMPNSATVYVESVQKNFIRIWTFIRIKKNAYVVLSARAMKNVVYRLFQVKSMARSDVYIKNHPELFSRKLQ